VHYRKPTKYDTAAPKTIWIHNHEVAGNFLYIQTSENKFEPDWKRVGDVLEKAFTPYLEQEAFITECLRLYHKYYENAFLKINEIIKPTS